MPRFGLPVVANRNGSHNRSFDIIYSPVYPTNHDVAVLNALLLFQLGRVVSGGMAKIRRWKHNELREFLVRPRVKKVTSSRAKRTARMELGGSERSHQRKVTRRRHRISVPQVNYLLLLPHRR